MTQRLDESQSLEIEIAKPGDADAFWHANDRAWRSELWAFKVIWHEQTSDIVATLDGTIVGALRTRIAASLAHVEALYVEPAQRRRGIGRALLDRCEQIANYYNCHKVTVAVFDGGAALRFFVACGYHVEAVLPQHTFKLDVAMVRKFLL
jgi:ribosomal protein S18 acetylase RimI-like enzyme